MKNLTEVVSESINKPVISTFTETHDRVTETALITFSNGNIKCIFEGKLNNGGTKYLYAETATFQANLTEKRLVIKTDRVFARRHKDIIEKAFFIDMNVVYV